MKKAKKEKRGPGFVTVLVLLVLIAVMGVELIQMSGRIGSARSEQAAVAEQVQQRRQENESLKADLEKAGDKEFIKNLAREQLGYAEANERIFYPVD